MKIKKNGFMIACVFLLSFACFISKKANFFMTLDMSEVLGETFSVAAINLDYKRSSLREELASFIAPPQKQETVNKVTEAKEEEKINVVEKKVTYNPIPENGSYSNVSIKNHTSNSIDVQNLMNGYSPVKKKKEPQILIIHTHATEGYFDSVGSRTVDVNKNMIAVGNALETELEKRGFNVLHDVKLHDYPSYNGSYANSLKTMNWYMENYDNIDIILDLHRDAVGNSEKDRVKFVTSIKDKSAAQLMFVTGTNEGGLNHPHWKENLKFAVGLQNTVCSLYPDLMRTIDLRKERFNQHVTKNSVIIEVGSNGNTIEEAKYSMQLLAEAFEVYIKE